jgi:hypothetical protein
MGTLGSLSLCAVLPKLLEGGCDIKILISTTFSRYISGNRAFKLLEDNDLVLVGGRASRFAR